MSNPLCHAGRMKINKLVRFQCSALHATLSTRNFQPSTVARFGSARLILKPDGRHELFGGTADDHAAAREWCSLFAHEVVFKSALMPRSFWAGLAFAE